MKEIENKVVEILDKLRPFLINDGGDIEFIKFEDGIVYVKFIGACSDCPLIDTTLEDGIKATLIEEIPEVIDVINVK